MTTKLKTIFATILLLLALICCQCESPALLTVDLTNPKGDVTTPNTLSLIGHSKIERRRHLEEQEDGNVYTKTNKPKLAVLIAATSVIIVTIVILLSIIPVLMDTKRSCVKSMFWVANAHVHPPEVVNQYLPIVRSTKNHDVKTYEKQVASHLADIFVPSFACGVILATVLFLVIPEAILLIQRGTSSYDEGFEIVPGTISRFGAAFMTGYMLPLLLGALFPKSPELFYTEECVSSSDLRIKCVRKEVEHQVIVADEEGPQDEGLHRTVVTGEEQQDMGSSRTTTNNKFKMYGKMPAVFERLSKLETVAFLHQKFYPSPGQEKSTSPKFSKEEPVIDSISEKEEDSTYESKFTNTISEKEEDSTSEIKITNTISEKEEGSTSEIKITDTISEKEDVSASEIKTTNIISDTSDLILATDEITNKNEVSEEILIDNPNLICHTSTNGDYNGTINNDPISDASANGDYNAKTKAQEIHSINFPLAASILIGDVVVNFIDGMFIGVILMTCSTAAAVCIIIITIYKETSQKTADYFLLTKFAGISIPRAVLLIFTSDLSVIVGALVITFACIGELAIGIFLAIASGVYFHISASECQPRVYSVVKVSRDRWFSLSFFIIGTLPVGLALLSRGHCNA